MSNETSPTDNWKRVNGRKVTKKNFFFFWKNFLEFRVKLYDLNPIGIPKNLLLNLFWQN